MNKKKGCHKKIDLARTARTKEKAGETIKIAESEIIVNNLRPFGLSKGDFIVPNNFDALLPKDALVDFEN